MIILPGLTSTKKERIPAFLADMRRHGVKSIALFPTCLTRSERQALYAELEGVPGLGIPHVHLRSDCGAEEIEYLAGRFGTEAFNIHPRASTHPFGPLPPERASSIYVENVDVPPEEAELEGDGGPAPGGLCPDFSHLENARLMGMGEYVSTMDRLFGRFPVGCCHLSAVRVGVPNQWSGQWDHHEYARLSDLDYLAGYRDRLPARWASLELENGLEEQLEAVDYLGGLLASR